MNDTTTPASNAEILPVGMLANGRGPAQAMDHVARRKNGIEGWEPFHYEKISATEFEVTGAIPALIGGAKKWPEPHTTVIVSEEEIAQELAADSVAETLHGKDADPEAPAALGAAQSALSAPELTAQANSHSTPKYMTVVLRMPVDKAGHQRIADTLALNKNFFGAVVMATSFQDEILVSEFLQKS